MKSDNKSINTSDKASQSSNKSSTAKHSNPILQKDKRGIPIVQPTDKITVSSLRQKTKKLNKDIDTSEINDEVQVCKMRSRDNSDTGLRSQSSTSRSRSVAAHYFQSTHLVHSSTRTFSESWQDASTEPLNADSPTLHSQNNPPTENTRKEEFDLHHLNTLNASPSGDTEQPTLSPPAQSTATQSTATQSTAEPQSITTTQSLPDQSAVAQSTAVQSTATQSEEKTSSPQTPESYNLLKRKIMTEDDDIYTTEANKKQRHLTKGSDVQQSEPVHVNSSPKTMLPRPQPKAAPSEENLDASQASNKDNSLKRKTVTDDDDTYTTEVNKKQRHLTNNSDSQYPEQPVNTPSTSNAIPQRPRLTAAQKGKQRATIPSLNQMQNDMNMLKRKIFDEDDNSSDSESNKKQRYLSKGLDLMPPIAANISSPSNHSHHPTAQTEGKDTPVTSMSQAPSKATTEGSMQTVTYNSGDEREEQEKVVENIESLMANVTCLENYYKLVDRIGFGTFSTVYLAEDIRHNLYNNDEWRIPLIRSEHLNDIRPGEESSNESEDYQHLLENDHDDWSEFVALKHIYSTSSPNRIAKEVQIMKILKGTLCVSPLITAFRERENIFMVMPYINHDDFKDIFPEMTVNDIKHYMKCLLTALKGVHSFGIIHRDVKPNNFLYNYRKKVGYLVDFGLAESENECRYTEAKSRNQAKHRLKSLGYSKNTNHQTSTLTQQTATFQPMPASVSSRSRATASSSSTAAPSTTAVPATSAASSTTTAPTTYVAFSQPPLAVASSSSSATAAVSTTSRDQKPSGSRPSTSQAEPAKVAGRVNNDPRLPIRANRAGTRGFRAPEVLLRVPRQTCAIDVWSAGVILLCFLTSRYPFFMAGDESDGLIELCQVFGLKDMETCAKINHRGLHLKLDKPCKRIPWIDLIKQLNDHSLEEWSKDDLYLGIDLLDRLLKLDPYTRISAEDALTHPFFDIM